MEYTQYYLTEFKKYISLQTASINTIKNYLSDLRLFLFFVTQNQRQHLDPQSLPSYINGDYLARYEQFLAVSNPPTTAKRRISSLKKFIDYCATQGIYPAPDATPSQVFSPPPISKPAPVSAPTPTPVSVPPETPAMYFPTSESFENISYQSVPAHTTEINIPNLLSYDTPPHIPDNPPQPPVPPQHFSPPPVITTSPVIQPETPERFRNFLDLTPTTPTPQIRESNVPTYVPVIVSLVCLALGFGITIMVNYLFFK